MSENVIDKKYKEYYKNLFIKNDNQLTLSDIIDGSRRAFDASNENIIDKFMNGGVDPTMENIRNGLKINPARLDFVNVVTQIQFTGVILRNLVLRPTNDLNVSLDEINIIINKELSGVIGIADFKERTGLSSIGVQTKIQKIVNCLIKEYKEYLKINKTTGNLNVDTFFGIVFFKMIDIDGPSAITLDNIIARFEAPAIQI